MKDLFSCPYCELTSAGHAPGCPMNVKPAAPVGWLCPRCGKVWSPHITGCTCSIDPPKISYPDLQPPNTTDKFLYQPVINHSLCTR